LPNAVTPYKGLKEEKKTQVTHMFDTIAPTYDKLNRLLSFRLDQRWRKAVVKLMAKDAPQHILDVATGTGDLALALLAANPKKVVGVDLSEKMLDVCAQKLVRNKAAEQVTLQQADVEKLPFANNSFDGITCAFGVRNFENLHTGLQEMARVLKPLKQVLILEFSRPSNFFVRQIYYLYFFNVLPFIGKWISKDKRAYVYLPESARAFPSGKAFARKLKQAGFNHITLHPLGFGICTIYQAKK